MELKTQDHPLFDDVGISFGRPEIMPPINKSSQGLQFCSSPQKLKFQDYRRDKLVVN
jgi:hypothetical protein